MTQGGLFDPRPVIAPKASPEVCRRESRERLSTKRDDHATILRLLAIGPMTDAELQREGNIHPNAIRARRGELVTACKVRAVGTIPQNGRKATLWGLV